MIVLGGQQQKAVQMLQGSLPRLNFPPECSVEVSAVCLIESVVVRSGSSG